MKADRAATNALQSAVAILVAIGVAAAVGRTAFPADIVTRADPLRERLMRALHRDDPFASERAAELDRFDSRYAAHRVVALLHVVPGGLFLVLASLQFSSRIRSRFIQYHRRAGRLLVVVAFVTTGPALYFGLLMPYGGPGEAAAIALFGALFLLTIGVGFAAIRRGQVARHREWMIRAFAIALGISTVRIVGPVFDIALTPAGFRPPVLFVFAVWTGWILTLAAAELWIRRTRWNLNPEP